MACGGFPAAAGAGSCVDAGDQGGSGTDVVQAVNSIVEKSIADTGLCLRTGWCKGFPSEWPDCGVVMVRSLVRLNAYTPPKSAWPAQSYYPVETVGTMVKRSFGPSRFVQRRPFLHLARCAHTVFQAGFGCRINAAIALASSTPLSSCRKCPASRVMACGWPWAPGISFCQIL